MRLRIVLGLFTIGLFVFLSGPDGYGQQGGGKRQGRGFPGGGGKGQGGKGQGGKGLDPSTFFNFMAKGQEFIVIDNLRGGMKETIAQYAIEQGITNGQITREQWIAYAAAANAKFAAGNKGKGPGSPAAPPGASVELLKVLADTEFKRFDTSGDGMLNNDEMPAQLRKEVPLWDKNSDSLIDRDEYRAYFVARFQDQVAKAAPDAKKNANTDPDYDEDLDKREVVYRAGKLPTKGLPDWFKQLDTDNDGQVALYEWRVAGRNLDEFKFWDRDDDGFVTPEEALHINAALNKTADPLAASDSLSANASASGQGAPNFGGNRGGQFQGFGGIQGMRFQMGGGGFGNMQFGGGGFGKGGFGKGGFGKGGFGKGGGAAGGFGKGGGAGGGFGRGGGAGGGFGKGGRGGGGSQFPGAGGSQFGGGKKGRRGGASPNDGN